MKFLDNLLELVLYSIGTAVSLYLFFYIVYRVTGYRLPGVKDSGKAPIKNSFAAKIFLFVGIAFTLAVPICYNHFCHETCRATLKKWLANN